MRKKWRLESRTWCGELGARLPPLRRRCQLGQSARAPPAPVRRDLACSTRSSPLLNSGGMETVYPAAASALARGRRARGGSRARHRTQPVTFAEIKEVDEENEEAPAPAVCAERERRRPDVLDERLGRQFAEFRRRRARRDALPEPPEEAAPAAAAPASASASRAGSEPLQPSI